MFPAVRLFACRRPCAANVILPAEAVPPPVSPKQRAIRSRRRCRLWMALLLYGSLRAVTTSFAAARPAAYSAESQQPARWVLLAMA